MSQHRRARSRRIWLPIIAAAVALPAILSAQRPDVIRGRVLAGDSTPLVFGEVLTGMNPTDPPVIGKQNDPMMPIAWTKTFKTDSGKSARTFTCTTASSQDFANEGVRRLLVNACYWAVGLDNRIPEKAKVDLVGEYHPSPFKANGFKKGVKPSDLADN